MKVKDELFAMRDLEYKEFHARLMPTIPRERIIGVRTPMLRAFAKQFAKNHEAVEFMDSLPHEYYEENNLHAFLIEGIKDYGTAIERTEQFLPYVDNWATCDSFSPRAFAKNKEDLKKRIDVWISSGKTYTVRYAIGMLMRYFLEEDFDEIYLEKVAGISSDEYYIKMMQAWYFATALAKQRNSALKYITEYRLNAWVHNKSIQKAAESRRISKEDKILLKQYVIKNRA